MIVHLLSDLHLDPEQPAISAIFQRYLAGPARDADQVYILGDLFELWAGDDVSSQDHFTDISAIRQLTDSGTQVIFIAGNRDFLCGRRFARAAGVRRRQEPLRLALPDGRHALLLHGDRLCSDDIAYQRFRRIVRNPLIQGLYFSLPAAARRGIARRLRSRTGRAIADKPAQIMDVNEATVADTFRRHECRLIIHGHTHRPQTHRYADGRERWVLADWHPDAGEVLVAAPGGLSRMTLN